MTKRTGALPAHMKGISKLPSPRKPKDDKYTLDDAFAAAAYELQRVGEIEPVEAVSTTPDPYDGMSVEQRIAVKAILLRLGINPDSPDARSRLEPVEAVIAKVKEAKNIRQDCYCDKITCPVCYPPVEAVSDLAETRAGSYMRLADRQAKRLKVADRLISEVLEQFQTHQFVEAASTPTDGSKDTRWMKEAESFLTGGNAKPKPIPPLLGQELFRPTMKVYPAHGSGFFGYFDVTEMNAYLDARDRNDAQALASLATQPKSSMGVSGESRRSC